jgi:hypothetical protein
MFFNTTSGQLQIFETGVWSTLQMPVLSAAPTIVSVVDNGVGKAYGDYSSITITYTLNETGGYAGNYTAISTPGGISQTSNVTDPSTSNTITIGGLTSNTNYTFTLAGNNNSGTGAAATTSSVKATSVPQAVQAFTPSNVQTTTQTITLTPGNTGGKAVTYTLLNNVTNQSITQSSATFNLTGLTPATSYTFTATATNDNGTSIPVTSGILGTLAPYKLLDTITSSKTFTVPSGVTRLAVAAVGPGDNGQTVYYSGGNGGNGGAAVIFWGQQTTAGTQYSVGIPSGSGGSTTFGNLLSVGTVGTYSCSVTNYSAINGGSAPGGNGTSILFPSDLRGVTGADLTGIGSGGAGGNGGAAVTGGIGRVQNRYQNYLTYRYASGGSAGGSSAGYNGGAGGNGGQGGASGSYISGYTRYGAVYTYTQYQAHSGGGNGGNYGGGGGGAGGNPNGGTSAGGNGGQGVVYVYGY